MSLRIGTFNVWGRPETFGFGDDVSSRMREVAGRLSRPDLDLLLVQEAWTEEVRGTLEAGALAVGFDVAAGSGASGRLMMLSRLPIRSARFDRFHFRGDPERLAQGEFLGGKGFQTMVIDGDGGPLTLIHTHLHARCRRARPKLNSAVRTASSCRSSGTSPLSRGPPSSVLISTVLRAIPNTRSSAVSRGRWSSAVETSPRRSRGPTTTNDTDRDGTNESISSSFVRVLRSPGARWTPACFSPSPRRFVKSIDPSPIISDSAPS